MKRNLPQYTERLLNDFARDEWTKVLPFLRKNFGLSREDSEDVFQESLVVLLFKCKQGRVTNFSSSLSTYFMRICVNKAHELLKSKYHQAMGDAVSLDVLPEAKAEKVEELIALDDDPDAVEAKEAVSRQIVGELPSPCNKLLWGFYRDNLSIRQLATLLGKTEDYVKVTKSRCQKKFRKKWRELTSLFKA